MRNIKKEEKGWKILVHGFSQQHWTDSISVDPCNHPMKPFSAEFPQSTTGGEAAVLELLLAKPKTTPTYDSSIFAAHALLLDVDKVQPVVAIAVEAVLNVLREELTHRADCDEGRASSSSSRDLAKTTKSRSSSVVMPIDLASSAPGLPTYAACARLYLTCVVRQTSGTSVYE
ncbi:hypothetical protein TYRP_017713 [Tyrophagus putrescentiae]|nr:hypothetical protein TYRP_017713 [Tyrophagus putrescentiae]